jgi:hypothetical protein
MTELLVYENEMILAPRSVAIPEHAGMDEGHVEAAGFSDESSLSLHCIAKRLEARPEEERLNAIGCGEGQLQAATRSPAARIAFDRRSERHVEAYTPTEPTDVLSIHVWIRGIVLEPLLVESPEQIRGAIQARAPIAVDRTLQAPLQGCPRESQPRGDKTPSGNVFSTVREAVTKNVVLGELGNRARIQVPAAARDESEGARRFEGTQLA